MCATSRGDPPECVTFRTIRAAVVEINGTIYGAPCTPIRGPVARLAYVAAKLRAAGDHDCCKAAHFLELIAQQP